MRTQFLMKENEKKIKNLKINYMNIYIYIHKNGQHSDESNHFRDSAQDTNSITYPFLIWQMVYLQFP